MTRDNETSALELHIKVNGQNLSAISENRNISTLRPPSDPSWPKIPLRRLNNNVNDIIEPPCVVTLIGTPRKGRSIVRPVTCQYIRPKLNQKYEVPTHIPKRLPGSIDPRFKRQISRQKTEKPDESCDTKNDKQTPEMHVSQEIEKPEDRMQGAIESADNYACYNVNKLLESVNKETTDCPTKEQFISEADYCKTAPPYVTNERREDRFPQVEQQETGRSLLLMVDEKKILPINAFNIEAAASSDVQPLQCYSVQIPVVAYHNVPLQISNISKQMQENIKIECQSDRMKDRESVGNIDPASTLINSIYDSKEPEKYPLNDIREHNTKIDIPGNKSISCCKTPDCIYNKEDVNSSVSLNQDIVNDTLLDKSHREKFNTIDNANIVEDGGSSSNTTTARRLKTVEQKCNIDNSNTMERRGIERKTLSETKIAKTSLQEQKLIYHDKNRQVGLDKSSTNIMNNKIFKRDIAFNEVKNKELKRKTAPINLSRKAKSFFRKKSRLAITDSDCTLILPGSRHVKGKQYEKSRLKVSQLLHRRNGINGTKSTIRIKSNNAKSNRQINSCSLTNLQAKGDLFEEPSSIPLETQELLNQSYWEYYWKLRRKIASANKPDNTGDRECLPESQTLQQCSVLSSMINTALRDSTAADGRSFSDPTFNVRENVRHETSGEFAKKAKRRKTKRASKRLLGLRIIALLSISIYVAVIFLPMLYDYFFDEEYENDYVDTNYIELALQYVASSFGEAFDGIIDILNTLLLCPVRID
ncbi:hypothetical protein EAG_06611 [Camponotus floridanus]|uniref:Uncharacterized protein n=1 Tax=Camponotus floridanus TaxID=104421 RepID=E2A772_CAMFO|nr:hypothetical protein EAG_06611 [Camponotus floridanus]